MSKRVLVDWHGPADYDRPFGELPRGELDFYFYYNRRTGGKQCGADCAHCFLKVPGAEAEAVSAELAVEVTRDLEAQGYRIGLTPADSFAKDVLATGNGGSAYRIDGLGNTAWTSGVPIALPDWRQKLERAREVGYTAIVMNAHAAAGISVPIAGVTKAPVIFNAIENIKAWNRERPGEAFDIGVTFTVRRDNLELDSLRTFVRFGIEHGVGVVRFNCFANFLADPRYSAYELSREDVATFYGNLAQLHLEFLGEPIQLSVSEDFGNAGIEAIEPHMPVEHRGQRVGVCRAGWRLFAITPINGVLRIVGCVDRMAPYLGHVERIEGRWTIVWYPERVEELRRAQVDGDLYGCFGGVGRNRGESAGFNTDAGNEVLARLTTPRLNGHTHADAAPGKRRGDELPVLQ